MFICRSPTRKSSDSTRYYTFSLCQSKRRGKKVQRQTLLNLSAHFSVEER